MRVDGAASGSRRRWMRSGGAALATVGLALIVGAAQATAATANGPYVSEITASCVSDGSYGVTGTHDAVISLTYGPFAVAAAA